MASTGVSRTTGRVLRDWDHVLQSLETIFSTPFGTRVMRRYFGSNVPLLLGENMVPETILRFYAALAVSLMQEPRVALIRITPLSVSRSGRAGFQLDVNYRPRGHLGDFSIEGARKLRVGSDVVGRLEVLDA